MDLKHKGYRIIDLNLSKISNTATSLRKAEAGPSRAPVADKFYLSFTPSTKAEKNLQEFT